MITELPATGGGTGEYAAAPADLYHLLADHRSTGSFLSRLADLAARTIGSGVSCGIALQHSGPPLTVAASGPLAALVQQLQYRLGDGPCLCCLRSGEPVYIADLTVDTRWPVFALRACAVGVRCTTCLPCGMQGMAAALSLCSPWPDSFGSADLSRARMFAEWAGSGLILGATQQSPAGPAPQLRQAVIARAAVDQALGVIMARERCGSSRAWAILRTAASNRGVQIGDLAREIVASTARQRPAPSRGHAGAAAPAAGKCLHGQFAQRARKVPGKISGDGTHH